VKNQIQIRHLLLFLVFIGIAKSGAYAQKIEQKNPWGKYIISPVGKSDQAKKQSTYQLIQLSHETTSYELIQNGFKIIRKLDEEYVIVLPEGRATESTKIKGQWLVNDDWKMSPKLSGKQIVDTATYTLFVKTLEERPEWLRNLSDVKVERAMDGHTFILKASGRNIQHKLLPHHSIYYIGLESQGPTTDSRVLDMNLNVNTINYLHNKFPQYEGQGIIASIQEQKFKTDDIDIKGRTVASSVSSDVESNHATEMATIIAGAGNSFINGKGVAAKAKITSSDFADVLPDPDSIYVNMGISIQNHSYGTEIENFYGVEAEAFDKSAHANQQLLHVLSSGNLGMEQDSTGIYKGIEGFANLSGNYKMAKNNLVIGSVDTVGKTINFVSNGPAFDGRVKPELVTYSTAGSSNSAALTSGVVTLLQQAYKEQHGVTPPSALLKALLINSARDVYNKGIDFKTGYGNLDAYRTLQNLLAQQYFEGSISHQQNDSFEITVPPEAKNLKITLTWNDPAASPNANKALVNDLDLTVDGPVTTWEPWVLNTNADATSLNALATRQEDHLNNVEQVTIEAPEAGTYTIHINGFDIPEGNQTFYITYQWDIKDQFQWTYPTFSDNMPFDGETGSYFRWNSTLESTTGQLAYSLDGGTNWKLIDSQVDLTKGHYRWEPPDVNAHALARITAGGSTFTTDTFTISSPVALKVGFNCTDSLLLQWSKIAEAESYKLYRLGAQYMETFTTTSDTSLVIYKDDFTTRYFSLQPHLSDGQDMIRSYTIDYDLQGTSCFLTSFYSSMEDERLFLTLQLGSLYGIKEIVFERLMDDSYQEIGRLTPSDLLVKFEEKQPIQGLNIHRATINFYNGSTIITEDSYTYYLTSQPFLVFPNPLRPGDDLNVYSKNFEPGTQREFILYNRTGQIVKKTFIQSSRGYVDTFGLKPGLYLYRVKAGKLEDTGRIVLIE